MQEKKRTPFDYINGVFLLLLAIVTAFPLYYVLIVSVGSYKDIVTSSMYLFPTSIDLTAYQSIFEARRIGSSFLVSLFVTVAGTGLGMFVSVAMAYSLSKSHVPGMKLAFGVVLLTMFFSGGMIPYYLTIKSLGLIDKVAVMILPTCVSVFNVIVLKNNFAQVPPSLEESARIDGANDMTILFRIVLPTCKPILATIVLFYAVERWNEWWHAMLFITTPTKQPLQIVLREVLFNFDQMRSTIGASLAQNTKPVYNRSVQMATVTVATLPILCVYPFLQKYFTKGLMIGAVKE